MPLLPPLLHKLALVDQLIDLLPAGAGCWLVGGALRDQLLAREQSDFDFALDVDPTPIARRLAGALGGTFILLDADRKQCRVVFKRVGLSFTCDFTPLRADSLHGDLALRDFTCNALACDIRDPQVVIDPLDGRGDLLHGILRPCSEGVLGDDPLRIVKGIRHCVELNLQPERSYFEQVALFRSRLTEVAPERIRIEFGMIFAHRLVQSGARMLCDLGVLEKLGAGSGITLSEEALAQVIAAEQRFVPRQLDTHLQQRLDEGWPLFALVRFVAALKGSPSFQSLFDGLRFSRKSKAVCARLMALDVRPCVAFNSRRARALWLDSHAPATPAAALYLASLPGFTSDDIVACFDDWLQLQLEGRVPDLISARELIDRWGVTPGADLGRGLERIRNAEISGRIPSSFCSQQIVAHYFKKD